MKARERERERERGGEGGMDYKAQCFKERIIIFRISAESIITLLLVTSFLSGRYISFIIHTHAPAYTINPYFLVIYAHVLILCCNIC